MPYAYSTVKFLVYGYFTIIPFTLQLFHSLSPFCLAFCLVIIVLSPLFPTIISLCSLLPNDYITLFSFNLCYFPTFSSTLCDVSCFPFNLMLISLPSLLPYVYPTLFPIILCSFTVFMFFFHIRSFTYGRFFIIPYEVFHFWIIIYHSTWDISLMDDYL